MADVSYVVEAILAVKGVSNFKADIGAASREASSLGSKFTEAAGSIGDAAINAGVFAAKVALVGAGAAVAGITALGVSVGATMKDLEDQSIKLGATIAASMGTGFKEAQGQSKELFNKFRQDAVKSAGETADFVKIASLIAGPILGAGKSMDVLHDTTAGAMNLIAGTLGPSAENFRQGGADLMRMLQGNAGVELPLFRQLMAIKELGIQSADIFNKLSVEDRFKKITAAMNNPAFKAAAEEAGQSFSGLASTAHDQMMAIGTAIGDRPFELIKHAMSKITGELMPHLDMKNGGLINYLYLVSDMIESRLVQAGKNLARIMPSVEDSAYGIARAFTTIVDFGLTQIVDGTQWLADHWGEIKNTAREIWGYLVKSVDAMRDLGSGSLLKGVERYFALAYGMKGVGAAGGVAKDIATASIIAKAAAGGEAAAAGTAGASGAAGGAASAAGGISFGAALASIGAVLLLVGAVFTTIKQNIFGLGDWLMDRIYFIRQGFDELSVAGAVLWEALGKLYDAFAPIWGVPLTIAIGAWLIGLRAVIYVVTGLTELLSYLAQGLVYLKNQVFIFAESTSIAIAELIDSAVKVKQGFSDIYDPMNSLGNALDYVYQCAILAKNSLIEMIDGILEKAGRTVHSRGQLNETEDESPKRYSVLDDRVLSDVGLIANNPTLRKSLEKPKPKAPPGKGDKIEVVLKVDLGNGQEDALLIRSTRELRKAFENAQIEKRLSTAKLPGVPS